ncbi:MAG: NifB/NifX family molybdenum-iron cluster-binding protein [Candidatus Omnitrophica bacterium]|nr:NifB/NifX family molybdenum-iron cluster-binding protein [Candidatus Omnitrophota bacterium]MDD5670337.1 NifB/NifX family molybdenum-iron cluster-binding protein [Candidatus Omnitrophota bacterium]
MKIAVTAESNTPNAQIDSRFGRCRYFLIFDTEKNSYEAIENSNAQVSGGAGIQSAQLIVTRGIETVLTGNVGPNAFKVLEAGGIKVMTNVSGTVAMAIEKFNQGRMKPASVPTVHSKFGAQSGQ